MNQNPFDNDSNPYHQPAFDTPRRQSPEEASKSHWSVDYGQKKYSPGSSSKGNFTERFSPPMVSRSPAPYTYERKESISQSSYHDSPASSYHDDLQQPRNTLPRKLILEKAATFRNKLETDDPAGARRRLLVFAGLCGSMLLMMLIVAGIWIKMDIVKKRIVTGLNNVAVSDVRSG